MSRLGFSVEMKAAPRRGPNVRDAAFKNQGNDLSFVASMVLLGLTLLVLGAFHTQARALLGQIFGF